MEHDIRLRASARAIYDVVYPTDELAPVRFEQAERFETIHYRRALEAAQICLMMHAGGEQLLLL